MDICRVKVPLTTEVGSEHTTACHLYKGAS
jgi:hypothetical protein